MRHSWLAICLTLMACAGDDTPGDDDAVDDQETAALAQPQAATKFKLTVTAPTGGSVSGGVIACPGKCSASFKKGTALVLSAVPDTGSHFVGWGGDCTGSAPTCTVVMTRARKVTATFAPNLYTLSFGAHNGNAWGWVTADTGGIDCGLGMYPNIFNPQHTTCAASYPYGTWVTVTAFAAQESEAYVGAWSGCDATSGATCQILIDGDRTATPNFYGDGVDITYQSLPDLYGNYGTGHVTSVPNGLNCGDVTLPATNICRWRYHWSSTVLLHFTVDDGYFSGWTGCDALEARGDGLGDDCVVGAFGTRTVTASFVGFTIF